MQAQNCSDRIVTAVNHAENGFCLSQQHNRHYKVACNSRSDALIHKERTTQLKCSLQNHGIGRLGFSSHEIWKNNKAMYKK